MKRFSMNNARPLPISGLLEEMTVLMRINMMTNEIASALYRLVKQPGMAQHFIEHLYETHAAHLEKRPKQPRMQLAPLSPETELPLAFLLKGKGENGIAY